MDFWTYFRWVALATGAVILVLALARYRQSLAKFFTEVRAELAKCSWPWDPAQTGFKKYRELIESTLVVVVCTILLAAFVSTSDIILAYAVGALTGATFTAH